MKKMYVTITATLFMGVVIGQDTQWPKCGKYNDKDISLGMFMSYLELKPDRTFSYLHVGDLTRIEGAGTYHMKKDTLILVYDDRHRDSVASRSGNPLMMMTPGAKISRPSGFLLKNERLYYPGLRRDFYMVLKE